MVVYKREQCSRVLDDDDDNVLMLTKINSNPMRCSDVAFNLAQRERIFSFLNTVITDKVHL